MSAQNWPGDPAIERWFRFKEDRTKHQYSMTLNQFLGFTGSEISIKDPSSLVGWAKNRDNIEVQDLIEKWGETQSRAIYASKMSTIRSLLKRNGVMLPSMSGHHNIPNQFHRAYTREEIISLLSYLDQPLQKLYVLFAKDSGLRAQDLLALRYHHIKKDLDAGKEYVHIALEPKFFNRRKASGLTFIGPNAVTLLKQLIAAKPGRKRRRRVQQIVRTDPDSFIFPIEYPTIKEALKLGRRKAGLPEEIQPSHGLRKFFMNSLDKVGMDVHKKSQIEGHSLGVRFAYTSQDITELRDLYSKAYRFLDVSEESISEFSERWQQEKTDLERRVNQLEDDQKELIQFVRLAVSDKQAQRMGLTAKVEEWLKGLKPRASSK